jgi:signal transduction histidine kinase
MKREAGRELPRQMFFHGINFSDGILGVITTEAVEDETVLLRFGNTFKQSYTRFLDLQKAEAQAREAKIEAALERTRTQSMIMQHSKELDDSLRVFHQQVLLLGINSAFSFLWLPDEDKDRHIFWAAWEENNSTVFRSKAINYPLDRTEPATAQCLADWKSNEPVYSYHVPPAAVENYFAVWSELITGVEQLKPEYFTGGLYYVEAFMKYGCFGVMVRNELKEDEKKILARFAIEFERTYTRFLDLQKAEAQAREAKIETALEKVRSRTMAMQKSDELGDVATVLFKEMNQLVDNLWTCGFVLCERDRTEDEWWLSTETGFIPAFYLPNVGDVTHANIYNGWINGETYHTEQLEGEALKEHYDWLMNIEVSRKIFQDMKAAGFSLPTWQKLHCAYFSKGYLCIITQVPCLEEEIFKRFAQVFDLTYTRFLDLQLKEDQSIKLKQEKERLEHTLNELKATQKQLIQSEKMASLGELTAGIAHEIQNPLNFVNNFSEVSNELIDEMNAEIEKGDMKEAKAIANDIKQNLEKILHHGKRADGIVKGMLQHSRSSSATKEPTDINKLADEYLRLAYHGLRAKDKSFNATLKTDYDESISTINVIPQDIGRAVLNLITNAFYAASLPSKGGFSDSDKNDNPTVWVSTKKVDDKVLISVRDNGPGIPQKILDKIFQPFFTTKPTGQGTGLGLSLSYDIVKAHGGELKVETKEGEGSEFFIQLPATV